MFTLKVIFYTVFTMLELWASWIFLRAAMYNNLLPETAQLAYGLSGCVAALAIVIVYCAFREQPDQP